MVKRDEATLRGRFRCDSECRYRAQSVRDSPRVLESPTRRVTCKSGNPLVACLIEIYHRT